MHIHDIGNYFSGEYSVCQYDVTIILVHVLNFVYIYTYHTYTIQNIVSSNLASGPGKETKPAVHVLRMRICIPILAPPPASPTYMHAIVIIQDFPWESPNFDTRFRQIFIKMNGLASCFSCFSPTSGLEANVLTLLEEYSLTRCVVRARTTGYRLGESPYGIVDEVCMIKTGEEAQYLIIHLKGGT